MQIYKIPQTNSLMLCNNSNKCHLAQAFKTNLDMIMVIICESLSRVYFFILTSLQSSISIGIVSEVANLSL